LPKTSRSRAGSKEPNRTSTNLNANKENLSLNGSQTNRDVNDKSSTIKDSNINKDNKESNDDENLELNGINITTAQEKANNKNVKSSADF